MHLLARRFVAVAIVFVLSSCGEPKADVALPKRYDKNGIRFEHAGNWRISEELKEEGTFRSVTIETQGDAIVIVQVFESAAVLPLKEYAELFSREAAKAMSVGKALPSTFTPLEPKDGWQRLSEAFSVRVVGVDVPHTRRIHGRDIGMRRCYVLCQVADEDLKDVEAGFEQVLRSIELE